jgi:hypothetical protein
LTTANGGVIILHMRDKEKRLAYMREWNRKWRDSHREQVRTYNREYARLHREKRREYAREYAKAYRIKHRYSWRGKDVLCGTSGLGRAYEKIALSILPNSIDANAESFHGGYDVEWDGKKVEVKMRNKNKKGRYGFTTKPKCDAQLFLYFCVDGENIEKIYLIPREKMSKSLNVNVPSNRKSKYDNFIVSPSFAVA